MGCATHSDKHEDKVQKRGVFRGLLLNLRRRPEEDERERRTGREERRRTRKT